MKIVNITPGLIQIPPNGWGAVEKIIWEYHNNFMEMGHESHIKYLSEVQPNEYDIVHIHVANLALEAHKRGIPYYFSMHDHHSVLYGTDSSVYKENREAIEKSVLSFLPARYLVDYFGLENAIYLPHGVNTSFFKEKSKAGQEHSILCVANNGYANDATADRKGFLPAIEVARKLGLPITICGPEKNNKTFFEKHTVDYDKLKIKYNLTEEALKSEFHKHTIFLHLSELEAGHPNLTITEAMASGLVVVGTLEADTVLDGFVKVTRGVDEAVTKIKEVLSNYDNYRRRSLQTVKKLDWNIVTKELMNHYKFSRETIREKLINSYMTGEPLKRSIRKIQNKIYYSFLDGPKVEILGNEEKEYTVKFTDSDTGNIVFETKIRNNHWAKSNIKYYVNWDIRVYDGEELINVHRFNAQDRNIFIKFESSSLGDTLAWIPFVEEFRKKHNCNVICSTFMNELFEKQYPKIKWVSPGSTTSDIYAVYQIGWFYNEDGSLDYTKNPIDFKANTLQKTASDILGLDYYEIRPKLDIPDVKQDDKLIVIAMQSTAQSKYWNNETGWKEVVEYLNMRGYKVACIDRHSSFGSNGHFNVRPAGTLDWTGDFPLQKRMEQIKSAKLFIGLGSGLSWLSWALGKKTVLISGFSDPYTEMTDCIRVSTPPGKCTGCFNRHRLDAGDWFWCPEHKGTDRAFECSKSITPEMVIQKLEAVL